MLDLLFKNGNHKNILQQLRMQNKFQVSGYSQGLRFEEMRGVKPLVIPGCSLPFATKQLLVPNHPKNLKNNVEIRINNASFPPPAGMF